ncbi:hypothetical protein, partial [Streptomyces sp. EN16]|uniref:hypothetical protein n=1 Tax=Streptomyces sp. EN16 TaxID=212773 RepID=UPI001C402203
MPLATGDGRRATGDDDGVGGQRQGGHRHLAPRVLLGSPPQGPEAPDAHHPPRLAGTTGEARMIALS